MITILDKVVSHRGCPALELGSAIGLMSELDDLLHWKLLPLTHVLVAALCHKQDMAVMAYARLQ